MAARSKAKAQSAKTPSDVEVVKHGSHGEPESGEKPAPFELEVGSAAWERLADEGKLGAEAQEQSAALKERQDEQDSELSE